MQTYKLLFITVLTILAIAGCKDKTDITAPGPASGNVDLSTYVAIGNSITAGYQSSALYESSQIYSFGKLIAQQANTSFEMPLISEPGIGGKITIASLSPFKTFQHPSTGQLKNGDYPKPYNNLGVYGAYLKDVLNTVLSPTNPYFNVVLRGRGTQFQQAKALNPTFVTFWMGNNDILGYATTGGSVPFTPTGDFASMYKTLSDSLGTLGAKVVVANIPNVTDIPFFTTVGPSMALSIPWSLISPAPGIFYQKGNEAVASSYIDSLGLLQGSILVTLKASVYAPLIGTPTGKWYKDNQYPGLPPGVDTTKPFGLHPQNPFPGALVLDGDEMGTVLSTTTAYNNSIKTEADAHNFGYVDINTLFKGMRQRDFTGGTSYNGLTFTTTFVTGGIFSLDGVHPSNQGQGIIANEFIKVINNKFGSNFPLVNIASIPGSLELGTTGIPATIRNAVFDVNWSYFTL